MKAKLAVLTGAVGIGLFFSPTPSRARNAFDAKTGLPIRRFVESIDLKCYRILSDVRSLDLPLQLEHLNPVLREMGLPPEGVIAREPQQLCVPVMKEGQNPDPDILPLLQYLDLKCYRIESDNPSLDVALHLDHLNPVFRRYQIPPEDVMVRGPQQLCVPVAKNGQIPHDDAILNLISYIDLKCYGIDGDVQSLDLPLHLDHLNPVFQQYRVPPEDIVVRQAQQLCVPVAKDGRIPPDDVLQAIQYLDIKKYKIDGDVRPLNLFLRLDHLNPLFREMRIPPEQVVVLEPQQLGVPVAKNGVFPPVDAISPPCYCLAACTLLCSL